MLSPQITSLPLYFLWTWSLLVPCQEGEALHLPLANRSHTTNQTFVTADDRFLFISFLKHVTADIA